MRWSPLARKEARTVATSKGVWLLAALLVPWGYRPSYVGWDGLGANITAGYVQVAGTVLLPLGVLLLSYQSIVGERTSGSVKFVLGLPLTRTDVLLGKIVGRTAGIAGPVSIAFLVLAVIGVVDHGLFEPLPFLGTVIVTLLTGLAGGVLFAVLTGKGLNADSGLLLTFFVVFTTLHAARSAIQQTSLSAVARYGAVPLVFFPAIVVYAVVYEGVSTLLPVGAVPTELTLLHGVIVAVFVGIYVGIETGIHEDSQRLYVTLLNAGQPSTETVLTSAEDYNEY